MLDDDLAAHIGDYFRCGAAKEDMMDSIAQKLSWEIVAMNDRGDYRPEQLMALEIAYGVACAQGDPASFSSTMASIAKQVSDTEMTRLLQFYAARGLKR